MQAIYLCLLLAGAYSLQNQDDERPIAKVVNMLKDMQAQLEKEAEEDAEAYEQMQCWCETGYKDKQKAIADGEMRIKDLASSIEENAAKSSQCAADIEMLTAQVASNKAALEQSTGIRDKELAEFVANEKDMIQTIVSLKDAVITLSKTHGEGFIQVKELLQKHAKKHRHLMMDALTHQQRRMVLSLVQESSSFKAATPASGEIYGVLKQMKESFETNLDNARKEEKQAVEEYGQLKEAKTSEIAAGESQIEQKTVTKADADEAGAQDAQDKKDTEAALEADQEFLADLESKCAVADKEYQARVKVRTEEIQAVSETMGILTNDEAQDTFTRNYAFVQRKSKTRSEKLSKVSAMLRSVASKVGSPRLVTLAVSLKLDAFAKVKANIDEMVAALKEESKDEIKDRDFCIAEMNTNERQTNEKNDMKADLDQKIADLTASVETLTEALTALKNEVTNTQIEMKKASANREQEHKDYTLTVQDQQATQAILTKALDRLKAFYEKKALLQTENSAPGEALAPPPEQKTYQKSAMGGGVMAMIEGVVKESKDLEMKALSDEQDSQAAYEGFIKASNKLIATNNKDIANKSEAKAKDDMALAEAKGSLKTTIEDILSLADMAKSLQDQCGFLLKNFDERQSKRTQEIDALNQAKAIFSGMK